MTIRLGFLLLAVALNATAAFVSRFRRSVSPGGGVAGTVVGTLMLYTGGFLIWGMLMLFFVSSTMMSRVGATRKAGLGSMHEKGSERDAVQVLANAGVATIASVLYLLTEAPVWAAAAAGALAAANADTWASELGVLSTAPPRSVLSRRVVVPGESGGVSRTGNLAALAGGVAIAVWFSLWMWGARGSIRSAEAAAVLFGAVTLAGVAGSFVDSVIGATAQALYQRRDGSFTEQRFTGHTGNRRVRGSRLVTNDLVNFICTASGAAVAGGSTLLVGVL